MLTRPAAALAAILVAGALLAPATGARAQGCGSGNPNCVVPLAPLADNSSRAASTAWVNALVAGGLPLASGKIWIGSAGNIAAAQTPSGDCTLSLSGAITCTQSTGPFTVNGLLTVTGNLAVGGAIIDANGILATNIVAPATPAAGTTRIYVDSTQKVLTFKNDAGTVGNAVVPSTCAANQFGVSVSAAGVFGCAQPAVANISGFGTGVATALGINIGSAGAFTTFNGAHGTPSSIVLTNATGLPTTALTGVLQAAQEPAHTGGCTNSAGSLALSCQINTNLPMGFGGNCGSAGPGLTVYFGPTGCFSNLGTEATVQTPVSAPITLKNFYVSVGAAAGGGFSYTFTVRKNGADTAITCAISGASATICNDTTHTASYVAGDLIDVKLVTSAGAANVNANTMSTAVTTTP